MPSTVVGGVFMAAKLIKIKRDVLRRKSFPEHLMLFTGSCCRKELMRYGKMCEAEIFKSDTCAEDAMRRFAIAFVGSFMARGGIPYRINGELMDALTYRINMDVKAGFLMRKMDPDVPVMLDLPYRLRDDTGHGVYHRTAVMTITKKVTHAETSPWLVMALPNYRTDTDLLLDRACLGKPEGFVSNTALALELNDPEMTVDELLNRGEKKGCAASLEMKLFIDRMLKAVLYIMSGGNPDLRAVEARPVTTAKPKKILRQFMEENVYPCIDVGMGFNKSPLYIKDQWEYLRWQPYGPRSDPDYRLIKITAHRRKPLALNVSPDTLRDLPAAR
jgi:hypothetical protein